jgi:hypothetical protein
MHRSTNTPLSAKHQKRAIALLIGAVLAAAATAPIKGNAAPYGSAPFNVPATIEAEHFDRGGEGVGYHDLVSGNAGRQLRTSEDVDIIAISGGHAVNNIQTGEWLAYTINVPTAGTYKVELLASTAFTNSSFHVQIDGVDKTGPVSVPTTGGWGTFRWVGKGGIALSAGTHVIKVFANQQYFNLDKIRVTLESSGSTTSASSTSSTRSSTTTTPYSGTPVSIPGVIQAENFDRGGQGVAYHDLTGSNSGKAYRPDENVDIIAANGGHVVTDIRTGEWMKYSIRVAETGQYDIGVGVATAQRDGAAFHIQIDGTNVTGTVSIPNTRGWSNYRLVRKNGVTLTAGEHEVKLVANRQYFNLDSIRITRTATAPAPTPSPQPSPTPQPGARQFFCSFESSPTECGFSLQARSSSRATLVAPGRDGARAVRLRTESGDSNLFGSGSSERADLSLSQGNTDCSQGKEAWWAHSVMFPNDYVPAANGFGVVMDFHHTGSSGQANFHLDSSRWDGQLHFRGYGGSQDQNHYETVIGPVAKNQWYDFVYHVRWSSGSDGFMRAWVNGVKKLDRRGPTLYAGQGCYLKLANYHSPFGQGTSIIHDRVIRGTTWQAVSRTPLEGVN